MTAETPYVTPDYALRDTIIVLVGVVVGGMDRLWTAALGGFAIGFASQALAGFLPSTGSWPFTSGVYLDSAVFGARHPHAAAAARRPVHAAEAPGGGAGMRARSSSSPAPSALIALAGFWASFLSNERAIEFETRWSTSRSSSRSTSSSATRA